MEAAQETPGVTTLPFGLTNVAAAYQDALRGKFTDQVGDVHPLADQPSPAINMLHVGRRPEAPLQTILEENPDSESQGSTEIIAETTTTQPPFLPFHAGGIFNVSVDTPSRNGETKEERAARVNRNVNRAQRRANEAALAMAEAQLDS